MNLSGMVSFLKESHDNDPEAVRARIITFRYYLGIIAAMFFIGAVVDLVIDFKAVSVIVFLSLTVVPLIFLGLSLMRIPHRILLYSNLLVLLLINQYQLITNPMA